MNISVDDSSQYWAYAGSIEGERNGNAWIHRAIEVPNDANGLFNGTDTFTTTPGSSASLTFQGSAIYYYGLISSSGGLLSFSVDGNPTNVSTVNDSAVPIVSLVYQQDDLDPTIVHTVSITMLGGSSIDIDRVVITAPPPTVIPPTVPGAQFHTSLANSEGCTVHSPSSVPSQPSSSTSRTSSTLSTTSTPPSVKPISLAPPPQVASSPTTPNAIPESASVHASSTPASATGPVQHADIQGGNQKMRSTAMGASIGVVAVLALLSALMFFWRRWRKTMRPTPKMLLVDSRPLHSRVTSSTPLFTDPWEFENPRPPPRPPSQVTGRSSPRLSISTANLPNGSRRPSNASQEPAISSSNAGGGDYLNLPNPAEEDPESHIPSQSAVDIYTSDWTMHGHVPEEDADEPYMGEEDDMESPLVTVESSNISAHTSLRRSTATRTSRKIRPYKSLQSINKRSPTSLIRPSPTSSRPSPSSSTPGRSLSIAHTSSSWSPLRRFSKTSIFNRPLDVESPSTDISPIQPPTPSFWGRSGEEDMADITEERSGDVGDAAFTTSPVQISPPMLPLIQTSPRVPLLRNLSTPVGPRQPGHTRKHSSGDVSVPGSSLRQMPDADALDVSRL